MFGILLPKIIPLYALILLGFIGGRYLKISAKSIADLVILIISPVVFFGYIAQVEFSAARAFLPVITFIIPLSVALLWFWAGKFVFNDSRRHLSSYASACGNTGYFGIPVFVALFDANNLGLYTLAIVGYMFFECGPGYFILARGSYNIKDSVKKVLSLPPLYAAVAGIIWSISGLGINAQFLELITQFKGAYIVTGMMLIGLALSNLKSLQLDLKLLGITFLGKFLAMPVIALATIAFISKVLRLGDPAIIHVLATYACVPMAANLSAYTLQLDLHPEKAAAIIFLSTAFALLTIPLLMPILLSSGI